MESMAADCIRVAKDSGGGIGKFCLAGHSWGCLVALEMARQLESAREQVQLLCLFDPSPEMFLNQTAAPEEASEKSDLMTAMTMCWGGKRADHDGREELAPVFAEAMNLADLVKVLAQASPADCLDDELQQRIIQGDDIALAQRAQRILDSDTLSKAHMVADARAHNLRLRPPHWPKFPRLLQTEVLLVLAVDQDADDWARALKRSKLLAAFANVAENVTIVWTPGDHYKMLAPPHCEALARTVAKARNNCDADRSV